MKSFNEISKEELQMLQKDLLQKYEECKDLKLDLNMARGKPCAEQSDLSLDLLKIDDYMSNGVDCRNYGGLQGLEECRKFFGELFSIDPDNIIMGPTASLTLMYDYLSQAMYQGLNGNTPWSKLDKVKFLCPVPGYDRHFNFCEFFGIEMIPVDMNEYGPDMNQVKELIKDETVKGMFCVPKYSNPSGITYSDDVVKALATMKPAAKDFRIIYDNAYCVHDLYEQGDELLNIFDYLENKDMVVMFASTSKITFAGGGISLLATSKNNVQDILKRLSCQTISYDKLNQLRHVRYFKTIDGLKEHMKKHAEILRPKFDCVLDSLETNLGGKDIATWHKVRGGYFISLDVMPGCAKRVGELCKNAGVILTTIGSTYPYGNDPLDSNIRIAPSFPKYDELSKAMEVICLCTQIAAIEKILKEGC